MRFLHRLGYFLGGLAIGLVALAFFLRQKNVDFCYFPNCRVLKDLNRKPLNFSENVSAHLSNNTVDSLSITSILLHGNIDFSNSNTISTPCKTYIIEGLDTKEKELTLEVLNCSDKVIVNRIEY